MGDVVSLEEYAKKHPKSISNKNKDYTALQSLEKYIFGTEPGESFLEMIAGTHLKTERPMHALEEASYLLGLDLCNTRYTEFQNYNHGDCLLIAERAIIYFQKHEPGNIAAINRLFSYARHLYRYEMGLPKLSDIDMINDHKSMLFGMLEYKIREYLVQRKLNSFRKKALKYK